MLTGEPLNELKLPYDKRSRYVHRGPLWEAARSRREGRDQLSSAWSP